MDKYQITKTTALLLCPLLLFALLVLPYSWLNSEVLVDQFGCGCPQIDENGNIIDPNFNANTFTGYFWLFISVCVSVIAFFLSRKIFIKYVWFRVIYVVFMLTVSLTISYHFYQIMMWN